MTCAGLPRALFAALAGLVAASCACGSHMPAPATDAAAYDAGPFVCGTWRSPFFDDDVCTAERDVVCQRWAQALTPTGTAMSRCFASRFGGGAFCTRGTGECNEGGACLCGTSGTCSSNDLCLSDPPGSTPRCTMICTQEEPSP